MDIKIEDPKEINRPKLSGELEGIASGTLSLIPNFLIIEGVIDAAAVQAVYDAHAPGPSWADIRAERNARMKDCDWTQLPDAVLTFTEKGAWADYRQALRDVPQTYATPDLVVWPTQPS